MIEQAVVSHRNFHRGESKTSAADPRLLAAGVGTVQGVPVPRKELATRCLVSSGRPAFKPGDLPGASLRSVIWGTHEPAGVSGLWPFILQVTIAFSLPGGRKESLLCRKFPAQCLASCGTQQMDPLSLPGSTLEWSGEKELREGEQFPAHLSRLLTCVAARAASRFCHMPAARRCR